MHAGSNSYCDGLTDYSEHIHNKYKYFYPTKSPSFCSVVHVFQHDRWRQTSGDPATASAETPRTRACQPAEEETPADEGGQRKQAETGEADPTHNITHWTTGVYYISYTVYLGGFLCVTKFEEMGKICNIFNLQFKKLPIENDSRYNLCVFNYL